MLFFLAQGYRVIAHDRRGHGRSTQTDIGNEMDTYAADVAALAAHLDLKNAIHVGHSTVAAKWRATSPSTARGAASPRRADRRGAANHAQDPGQSRRPADRGLSTVSAPPRRPPRPVLPRRSGWSVLRFNVRARHVSQVIIDNWWRQGMMGGTKAHYDCIKAFSETDFTEDLKTIDVPCWSCTATTTRSSDSRLGAADDSSCSRRASSRLQGLPACMATTHADIINADLLASSRHRPHRQKGHPPLRRVLRSASDGAHADNARLAALAAAAGDVSRALHCARP